ncbi:MAG TPA: IS200/IS605 family transposase [Anaerolineaceae bacterium]|nr:IS200/IS605 family transposase [Anaerolineaceae bacterium]
MRAAYHELFVHLIWHTWDSQHLITPTLEPSIYACIAAKCQQMHTRVIALGGTPNHVHLLVQTPPTICIADLIHDIKGASSHLVTHQLLPDANFKWQGAYAAFSLSMLEVDRLSTYIRKQKEHHKEKTLQTPWELSDQ